MDTLDLIYKRIEEQQKRIKEAYEKKMTIKEAAEYTGLDMTTVRTYWRTQMIIKGKDKIEVKEFFDFAEGEWNYTGHLKNREIIKEVEELNEKGIDVPLAAIFVCKKYSCPLNQTKVVKEFSVKLKEIGKAREKFGIHYETDYVKMVAKTLYGNKLVKKEGTEEKLNELLKTNEYFGTPKVQVIRAGYDLLTEQGIKLSRENYCDLFKITPTTLRNAVKER